MSFFADYGPKGCRGERREADIQWIQPPKAVSDPEFRQTTSGTHGSANRADCLPQGKPPACINKRQLCRKKFPLVGIDAPTPAREKGLQPYGALDCFRRRTEGFQRASGKPFGAPAGAYLCPRRDLARRLRRGKRACSPMGRSIASSGDPKGTGGNVGKRVSSGYNRRRRLAPRSSGKQQAGRTAVRTAPIVCPEESPLLASIGGNFAVRNSP